MKEIMLPLYVTFSLFTPMYIPFFIQPKTQMSVT